MQKHLMVLYSLDFFFNNLSGLHELRLHRSICKSRQHNHKTNCTMFFRLILQLHFSFQAFHGHRGPISCLTFRQGTSQLFSGSFDRTIKLWNAEDRTHMDNLFGHQSEILTIDCLRRERLLTVGRDRTMRLWKVSIGVSRL